METISHGPLQCLCTALQDTQMITYILTPIEIANEEVHKWAKTTNCNIAVIYGIDWDSDLTPWTAPQPMKLGTEFTGNADAFLSHLISDTMPTIEKALGYTTPPGRTIAGISLSGLFALWAALKTDKFERVMSISGSLWYPGFVQWLQSQQGGTLKSAYLSLGTTEANTSNAIFRTVESATRQAVDILKGLGITTTLEYDEGGHHAPLEPRFEKAFAQC